MKAASTRLPTTEPAKISEAHLQRKPAGFWKQSWILFDKNWKTMGRLDKKTLIMEMVVPTVLLLSILLAFYVVITLYPDLVPIENSHEERSSKENASNVLETIRDLTSDGADARKGMFGKIIWYKNAIGRLKRGMRKGDVKNKEMKDKKDTDDKNDKSKRRKKRSLHEWEVHVAPKTAFTEKLCQIMEHKWEQQQAGSELEFKYHKSEEALEKYYQGLKFPEVLDNKKAFPENFKFGLILPHAWPTEGVLHYKIRINPRAKFVPPGPTETMAPFTTCRSKKDQPQYEKLQNSSCPVNDYFFSDFLALQLMMEQAVLSKSIKKAKPNAKEGLKIEVKMENFPKTAYQELLPAGFRSLFILFSITPISRLVHSLLVYIVTDKTEGVKDGLQMVGFSDLAYWLSYLGTFGITVLFFAIFYSIYLSALVMVNMDVFLLFLLYFLFGLSILTASFALSSLFDNPKTAGVTGAWLTRAQQYLVLVPITLEDPTVARLLSPLNLFSPYAFTRALDVTFKHYGLEWSDLKMGAKGETVLLSLIFLAVDNLIYGLLAVYLDNVVPSQYGVKKHPLFFLSCISHAYDPHPDEKGMEDRVNEENFEKPPANLVGKEAIKIKGVYKTFASSCGKNKTEILKGVYLDVYPGEITAILGKNGVGKSTLFSIITGRTAPTTGTVSMFGLNVRRSGDRQKLRKLIGVCFQHDLQFKALTVEEHLKFYGKLRGMEEEELLVQMERILKELELNHVRFHKSTHLSEAEQRMLSVAMALVGDSPVILLDEPSSGLDPASRRHLWRLLQHQKKGRVILMTTHFLDEADILADRKAILHDGKIVCAGSSLFLKNQFGKGYHLTVELKDRDGDGSKSDEIIEKWMPGLVQNRRATMATEVSYSLPHSEVARFPALFATLEEQVLKNESIKSFGICMTTLEEVFFSFSSDEAAAVKKSDNEVNLIEHNEKQIHRSACKIFGAFCWLRAKRLRRSVMYTFLILVVPSLLTAAGLAGLRQLDKHSVDMSSPQITYKNLRVAVKEQGNNFQSYLRSRKVKTVSYSGVFSDLLDVKNVEKEPLAAAVTIEDEDFVSDPPSLHALMRINGTFLHSPPIVLDLLSKYFSSQVLTGNYSQFRKFTKLQPRPLEEKFSGGMSTLVEAFSAILILCGAFVLTSSGLIAEIIHDREINVREQLRRSQVSLLMYFLPLFTVFGLIAICVIVTQIILIAVFQIRAYSSLSALMVIFILLVIHTVPCMLANALFSYLFDNAAQAQIAFIPVALQSASVFILLMAFVDFGGMMCTDVLPWTGLMVGIVVRLTNIFLASINVFYIPSAVLYWILRTHMELQGMFKTKKTGTVAGIGTFFSTEIVHLIFVMLCQTVVFSLLLILVDSVKFRHAIVARFRRNKKVKVLPDFGGGEMLPDVAAENDRVKNYFAGKTDDKNNNCVLAAQGLRKNFGKFKAVNGVSFRVDVGEVLVLVGHNGAGKTTAMKLIVGEINPKSGQVAICGKPLVTCCSNQFGHLGFCPQKDALWDNITLKEHLVFYATLGGMPHDKDNSVVNRYIQSLALEEHKEKYSQNISGGTRRKLSYCIAMTGAPKIVLMDEPTTGLDPESKRMLWNTIVGTFRESRGAVLTTHSMEEAEILSTRIALMMKGKIVCIGSPLYLKNTYGQGYTLEIKLKRMEGASERQTALATENQLQFLVNHFPGAVLLEHVGENALFSIPIKSVAKAFAVLEDLKSSGKIEGYSLSQSTLEQIFLHFTEEEEHEDNENV